MSSLAQRSALLTALALSACAAVPRQDISGPEPASAYQAEQSFTARGASWPGDGWWRAYGDPQLDRLIEEALAGAPDIAAAKARLAKADAAVGEARAALLPGLQGKGQIAASKQSYNAGIPPAFVPKGYNGIGQVTLDFSWELDFWGKNRKAVAAAASEAKASGADVQEARLVLSTAIAGAYADLARLWAEHDVAVRAAQSRQETLGLVSRRVADGADTRGELEQAKAGPANARADLAAIDEQIALSRNQIAALMGEGPDSGLAIARPRAAALKAFGLPATLAANLVGRRPDLAAARWRAEAAASRIGVAKAQFYPDINLAAFIGYQSLGISKLFAAGSDIGQVGPAVTLPIFEGGRLRANLRGARADYEAAVASYDQTLTQALHEVADAAASQRALSVRLSASAEALGADEEAYRIARLRYEGGLANYQSVLLAEDAVLTSRRSVVDLQARAFTLDVQLIRALGGGFHTEAN
jgi:NodT family efflux transporter outer membrane factor (OMF) lipoprotein